MNCFLRSVAPLACAVLATTCATVEQPSGADRRPAVGAAPPAMHESVPTEADPAGPPRAAYASRFSGRDMLVAKGGGTPRHLDAVQQALGWLARHQDADGGWRVREYKRNCGKHGLEGTCDPDRFTGWDICDGGVSGLALLAFLGAGYTHLSRVPIIPGAPATATCGHVVKNGLRRLLTIQGSDGALAPMSDKFMYNHILGTLALCEAYGMTGSDELREPARRAVDYLVRARNKGAGWRYTPQCGDSDVSVTGWALLALHAADVARIRFDTAACEDGRRFMDKATAKIERERLPTKPPGGPDAKAFTVTGYRTAGDAGWMVVVSGMSESYDYTPAMTALRMLAGVSTEGKVAAPEAAAVETLMAYPPPKWSPGDANTWRTTDFYYWYVASHALAQVLDPSDARWKKWNAALTAALVDTQNVGDPHRGKCREGSWEPVDRWSCEGGRVFATATAALALECYYQYPRSAAK